jgi:hypothetical protein
MSNAPNINATTGIAALGAARKKVIKHAKTSNGGKRKIKSQIRRVFNNNEQQMMVE